MKQILTFLLLFFAITSNAWQPDKTKHLIAGAFVSSGVSVIVFQATQNKRTAIISGVAASILVSAGKELIYDKAMKRGCPEWGDFGAGVIGATVSIPLGLMLK